jgi:hypothetical protein
MPASRRRCWRPVCSAAAVALLLASCTAGQSRSGGAAASTTTALDGSDPTVVHLSDYSSNDGARSSVILTGAIGDYGQAVTVNGKGATDAEHSDQLKLTLTHGSFQISIGGIDKKIVSAFTSFPANTTTCSGLVSVDGAAPIVPRSGTGSYQRIRGTFHLHVSIDEVDQETHCRPSSKFLSQAIVITGWADLPT